MTNVGEAFVQKLKDELQQEILSTADIVIKDYKNDKMISNLQLELLKIFSRPLPDNQVLEIKELLANYFAKKVDNSIDDLFEKNKWEANTKVDEWLSGNLRTPYLQNK